MFRKCKFCNNDFRGMGYFCSDVCEIKSHESEVTGLKMDTASLEKEELLETSVLDTEIVEKAEPIQVEHDIKQPKMNVTINKEY